MNEACEQLRLKNQLCYPVYLCAKELTRWYGTALQELGLTYTQYIVMMYFWEQGSSNVRELGKALLLDSSTLTPLLKKLEQKGLLSRSRSSQDERNLIVTLTDAGRALQQAALSVPQRACACLGLSEAEAKTLYDLTCKVLTNVEKEIETWQSSK